MDQRIKIPIEISAHHIHLTREDFYELFKKNNFTPLKQIGQHQIAAAETVTLVNGNRKIENVRLVAPFREKTQVEISLTEAIYLRIQPVLRLSGDLKNTPGIKIIGPQGELELEEGVIVALRHIHASPEDIGKFGINPNEKVNVLVEGKRSLILRNIPIRVDPAFNWCLHLDTDEGNACGISTKGEGYLVSLQQQKRRFRWFKLR